MIDQDQSRDIADFLADPRRQEIAPKTATSYATDPRAVARWFAAATGEAIRRERGDADRPARPPRSPALGNGLLDAGADLMTVFRLPGHERPETVVVSAQPTAQDPEAAVARLEGNADEGATAHWPGA